MLQKFFTLIVVSDRRMASVRGSLDRPSDLNENRLYIFETLLFYFFQRSLCIQLHYTHLPNKFFKLIFLLFQNSDIVTNFG